MAQMRESEALELSLLFLPSFFPPPNTHNSTTAHPNVTPLNECFISNPYHSGNLYGYLWASEACELSLLFFLLFFSSFHYCTTQTFAHPKRYSPKWMLPTFAHLNVTPLNEFIETCELSSLFSPLFFPFFSSLFPLLFPFKLITIQLLHILNVTPLNDWLYIYNISLLLLVYRRGHLTT